MQKLLKATSKAADGSSSAGALADLPASAQLSGYPLMTRIAALTMLWNAALAVSCMRSCRACAGQTLSALPVPLACGQLL